MSLKDKKRKKKQSGKDRQKRETADGLFTVDKRENKRPQLSRVTCMYTHTSKPVIKARDKVLFG